MTLSRAQRIEMITQCATLLNAMEWSKLDLILQEHGVDTWTEWREDTLMDYIVGRVRSMENDSLAELHGYLLSTTDGSTAVSESPFNADRLGLFLSHLSKHRDYVGKVASYLAAFGIDAFVAHQSIDISKEWQRVIEDGLSDCDGMIVFLHDGFTSSPWCDQELGWVMGRKRPVMILGYDRLNPHGFAGKFQALPASSLNPIQVGTAVLDWALDQPTLQAKMAEGLSLAFAESGSYDRTRSLIPRLEKIPTWTDEQLSRVEQAAKSNSQVREAGYDYQPVPSWVANFVGSRRSPGTQGWAVPPGNYGEDTPF